MLLAKGESSFCRKGKEVAVDDSPVEAVGGEAPHSKSDRFEEEEGGCDLGNECPPHIDPWYETYIHFSVVSGDYSPPSLGRVCLSLEQRDSAISWAPLASSIPDHDICEGTTLLVTILFKFESSTSLGWKEWVDMELFDVGFMKGLQ